MENGVVSARFSDGPGGRKKARPGRPQLRGEICSSQLRAQAGNPGGSRPRRAGAGDPRRVNRNTQARGRALPTCTNTLASDPRWFFFFPSPEKHGGSPKSRIRSLAPRLLLAAPRGNPQSVEAEPMSGGQNHKGIERLNIFLGAELGKGFGFWDVRSRCPPRTSFVLVRGTIFLHQTRI